jgi:hypothetical protein
MPSEPPDPGRVLNALEVDLASLRALAEAFPRVSAYSEAAGAVERAVTLLKSLDGRAT